MAYTTNKDLRKIHDSWYVLANNRRNEEFFDRDSYIKGAEDFSTRAQAALNVFAILSVEEVVRYNDKTYVSLEDVQNLIKGLYATDRWRTIKNKKDEKDL